MGSWYGTCGVSQLPIFDYDEVALFLLKKNKYGEMDYGGCVHSDGLYEPVSTAIIGEYDDYGRIKVVHYDKRNILYHYGKDADLSDVGKLIDEKSEENGLYFMLVHLDLYKRIVDKYGDEKKFYTKGLSFKEHMTKSVHEFIKASKSKDPIERMYMQNDFKLHAGYSLPLYTHEKIFNDDFENDKLVSDLVDFMIFREAMSQSRKLWIPQVGQGSQEIDFEMSKLIGEFAKKAEQKLNDEW